MTICLTEKVRRIIHTFGTTVEEQALHQFHFLVDGLLINEGSFLGNVIKSFATSTAAICLPARALFHHHRIGLTRVWLHTQEKTVPRHFYQDLIHALRMGDPSVVIWTLLYTIVESTDLMDVCCKRSRNTRIGEQRQGLNQRRDCRRRWRPDADLPTIREIPEDQAEFLPRDERTSFTSCLDNLAKSFEGLKFIQPILPAATSNDNHQVFYSGDDHDPSITNHDLRQKARMPALQIWESPPKFEKKAVHPLAVIGTGNSDRVRTQNIRTVVSFTCTGNDSKISEKSSVGLA